MIVYTPFFQTIKRKNISTYYLIKHGISNGTLYRMRYNKPLSTTTIDDLCRLCDCNVSDILTFTLSPMPKEESQTPEQEK